MNGTLLAATFSYGCKRADDLGISQKLEEYTHSKGKSHPEEETREDLKKLFSYFYYQVIALANGIEDLFDLKVVEAHWIGNELLERVKPKHIKQVFDQAEKSYDKVILAKIFEPLIKTGSAHHNFCSMDEKCRVVVKDGWFWHLGIKRLEAKPQELNNFIEYSQDKRR